MHVQERPSPGPGWLLAPGPALQVLSLGLKGPSTEDPLHLQGKDRQGGQCLSGMEDPVLSNLLTCSLRGREAEPQGFLHSREVEQG